MNKLSISKEALSAVSELQSAGIAGTFIDPDAAHELHHHKYVDLGSKHPSGKQAARLTPAGVEWAAGQVEHIASAHKEMTAKPVQTPYAVVPNVPIPPRERIPRSFKNRSVYPLDTMAIGESFHIPITPKRPEPWKTFVGTMYSAQTRLRKRGGDHSFICRRVLADSDPTGLDGARVWRVEPVKDEQQAAE